MISCGDGSLVCGFQSTIPLFFFLIIVPAVLLFFSCLRNYFLLHIFIDMLSFPIIYLVHDSDDSCVRLVALCKVNHPQDLFWT